MQKVYQFNMLLSILFFAISSIWLLKSLFLTSYPDYKTQYLVPKVLFSGMDPYRGGGSLFTPQVYPPSEFLFFVPFSLLPLAMSQVIYTVLSISAFYASFFLLAKTFSLKILSSENFWLMGLASIMFPVKFTFGMGQINMFILLLLTLCIWSFKRNRNFVSGVWLGTALVIKLFPPLLLGYFLLVRNKLFLYGVFVTFLVTLFFTLIFIPFHVIESFFRVLPSFINSWKLDYYNQALSGFVGRSFGVGETAVIVKNSLTGFAFLGALYLVLKNKKPNFLVFSLLLGMIININVVFNTFSWQHHFVWLIIPFYVTYMFIRRKKLSYIYFLILAASYILVAMNFKDPQMLPLLLQSHVFYGGIVLLFIQAKIIIDKK